MEVIDIRIEDICEAPYLALLSYGRDHTKLIGSVASHGLLSLPTVRPAEGGAFILVCGKARCAAVRSLGATRVRAMVRRELDDFKAFETAVDENLNGRGFNDVEKAGAVHYILKVLEQPEERIEALLGRLSIPVNPRTLSRYLELFTSPETMKLSVVNEEISFHTFVLIRRLDPDDAGALLQVIRDLDLGTNYQRDLVISCEDRSAAIGKTISEVLKLNEVTQVVESDRLSTPDKAKHLFKALRKQPAARCSC